MCSNRLAQEKTDGSEDCKRFSPYLHTLEMTDMNALSNNRTWRALAVSLLSFALASCGGDDGAASETLQNQPWFPSLMAFEHYDSGRTHLFEAAEFNGSLSGSNVVDLRVSGADFPTPYNVVYRDADSMFLFGGAYGDIGGTGTYVARVDPKTLEKRWSTQLIDIASTQTSTGNPEWNYPGVLSLLRDGYLYQIYGYRLAKLDARTGQLVATLSLPTAPAVGGLPAAELGNTTYNGLTGLSDGTLVAKSVYREAGCDKQGFPAFLSCPAGPVPNPAVPYASMVVAIDPASMTIIDQTQAPELAGGRVAATEFKGTSFVYLGGDTNLFRYAWKDRRLVFDKTWVPGELVKTGQKLPTAPVIMNDWVVIQTNALPGTAAMSVVAVNQADAGRVFRAEPFPCVPFLTDGNCSYSPSAVSVDPAKSRIYSIDGLAGRNNPLADRNDTGQIASLELRDDGLHVLWKAPQRTFEFLALIGPPDKRVVVGTDVPYGVPGLPDQSISAPNNHYVVWRNAATGVELARSSLLETAINAGTMIEPGYNGRMYGMGKNGTIIELTVRQPKM
jgi:hypothetical protein